MPFTQQAREVVTRNPNMLVPWFLLTSYAYYHLDETLVKDTYYDELCQLLGAHWDQIEHRHKGLVQLDMLHSGSGFSIPEDRYPLMVKGAVSSLLRQARELYYQELRRTPLYEGVPISVGASAD